MADGYYSFARDHQELQEEDIWGVVTKEREDGSPKTRRRRAIRDSSSSWLYPTSASSSRVIPRAGTSSRQNNVTHEPKQFSAPVNIPDWSRIYRGSSEKGSRSDFDEGSEVNVVAAGDVENYQDDDGEMMPPHEYISMKLARAQIASFSMCEGVGRTLKGRDLSKLRNAILTKTGFLE